MKIYAYRFCEQFQYGFDQLDCDLDDLRVLYRHLEDDNIQAIESNSTLLYFDEIFGGISIDVQTSIQKLKVGESVAWTIPYGIAGIATTKLDALMAAMIYDFGTVYSVNIKSLIEKAK